MIPNTSVSPAASRNRSSPNCRPFRHCSRKRRSTRYYPRDIYVFDGPPESDDQCGTALVPKKSSVCMPVLGPCAFATHGHLPAGLLHLATQLLFSSEMMVSQRVTKADHSVEGAAGICTALASSFRSRRAAAR